MAEEYCDRCGWLKDTDEVVVGRTRSGVPITKNVCHECAFVDRQAVLMEKSSRVRMARMLASHFGPRFVDVTEETRRKWPKRRVHVQRHRRRQHD